MEPPAPGFFFSSSPVLLFSPCFFFLSPSRSLCFPFLLPSACASLCLCTVLVSYLANLEKFTWKQDEDNGVLWTALFPFSLAFPLVNSFFSFAFPSYWYFFSSQFVWVCFRNAGVLKEILQSLSSVSVSLCFPVLPHISLSFFILPVLSLSSHSLACLSSGFYSQRMNAFIAERW